MYRVQSYQSDDTARLNHLPGHRFHVLENFRFGCDCFRHDAMTGQEHGSLKVQTVGWFFARRRSVDVVSQSSCVDLAL